VRLVRYESLVATPWKNGGGVTRQIAVAPPGGDAGSFDWRISSAEVATDGPFSRFEGIDRRLYILDGAGLDLRFDAGTRRLRLGEHTDFAGEAAVFGALLGGPVTDLNIMVRRDRYRMRAERMSVNGEARIDHGWGTAALFVLEGALDLTAGVARRFDTVLLDGKQPLTVSGSAELLLIGLAPVA